MFGTHKKTLCIILSLCWGILCPRGVAQVLPVKNDEQKQSITFGNSRIRLTVDYGGKVSVSSLEVNGQKVIGSDAGIFSEIRTPHAVYSTLRISARPKVEMKGSSVKIMGIRYGDKEVPIQENWSFTVTADQIRMDVERTLGKTINVEEVSFPAVQFDNINTWEGAYQGYGGLAWFYLFNERLATYGVHTDVSRFWNSATGNGLTVAVEAPGKEVAMKYSRSADDKLAYGISVSQQEMIPRFDSGTNRKRFIRNRTDVWAPFRMEAGKTTQSVTFSYFDFHKQYGRGKFVGMNGTQLSSVLNTIARIGVIDRKHFGGNSWHTPYGPICLHEQYIAQLGLAINDESYLKGYEECLDFYRDNAMKPDGRVWARWAYNNVDIMPGQVTDKGFYEAQWGFLLDANPDFVTNVAELFDQTGNINWVRNHQSSCEKALDWIIRRDTDGDGLVEMMTDSHKQQRGSDWIDIIWAAYENAFVNAKLYLALTKWADVELLLGNAPKAKEYKDFAARLKARFNETTDNGGFWDEENKCYVHWLDKDGSVHGRNMVTPVNFMAIAYGICEDVGRRTTILDTIEAQMQKEKLFFWPLTMSSYAEGEGKDEQFPFPFYENGDLFLSWGAVAVKAYAEYRPELALKYVRNVMDRHSKDGLAFQRYGRVRQEGLGDDILSGNSLSVVGLYQAIYGINPLYNRFYLNPHITPELAGTELNYRFRGQLLKIGLDTNRYSVSNGRFTLVAGKHFGFSSAGNELSYFEGGNNKAALKVKAADKAGLTLEIGLWSRDEMRWSQAAAPNRPESLTYTVYGLQPGALYGIWVNGKKAGTAKADKEGSLKYPHKTLAAADTIVIEKAK